MAHLTLVGVRTPTEKGAAVTATHDVFISYSRRDQDFVDRLSDDLKAHGLTVWLDRIDLRVGDQLHQSIERGIDGSRFFALVLSEASLASYYVREIEFETAFTKMIASRRTSYILPLMLESVADSLPMRLAGMVYLDFVREDRYTENVRKLAKRIKNDDDTFTGYRWYKSLNISSYGDPTGITEMTQMAPTGSSYKIFWQNGRVDHVDVYQNSKLVNQKRFEFDERGRVIVNKMFTRGAHGDWELFEDIWRYEYDPATGKRLRKFMVPLSPSEPTVELLYDSDGHTLEERIVTSDGRLDMSRGYARKQFVYDDGIVMSEKLYADDGRLIQTIDRRASESPA